MRQRRPTAREVTNAINLYKPTTERQIQMTTDKNAQIDPEMALERVEKYSSMAEGQPINFDDMLRAGLVTSSEISGSPTLMEKAELIGVPFIITGYQYHESEMGGYYTIHCVLQDNQLVAFNDGGSGIRKAIETWENTGHRGAGIMCAKGLRASYYDYNGMPATTYYLA